MKKLTALIDINNLENKEFYTITEVSKLLDIKAYILRYWEKHLLFTPIKISNGKRRYNKSHITLIAKIKDLTYKQNIGIKGVKLLLNSKKNSSFSLDSKKHFILTLEEIKKDLCGILKILK